MTVADDTEIEFATSGHTAAAAVWVRRGDQVRAEAELIASTVLGPVDHVVTFAPRGHLYGHLFGVVLPEVLGVGVDDLSGDPLAVPGSPMRPRTLYVCLPSSWPALRALVAGDADLAGSAVVHSTGPVTPGTSRVLAGLADRGVAAVELFGSTETGGIAYRPMVAGASGEPWRLLADVELVGEPGADGTCPLRVRGPRLARPRGRPTPPETYELTDVIRPLADRRFELLGRRSRLVKINGRRCDLGIVEEAVSATVPGIDVVCVGVRDQACGEHYELFCAGASGDPARWLPAALGTLPAPRAVHRVGRIPRTITGKVRIDRLFALTHAGTDEG
jgi:acyl-coenzyme A synthetase/AMP-(fatty) acid ligase